MARLLYSALDAEGHKTEGFVDAETAAAAREQLLARGLREVQLHQEVAVAGDASELSALGAAEQQALARFRLEMIESPRLATALVETARRSRFWLLLFGALVVFDAVVGRWAWVALLLAAMAVPFARTAWGWRHAERYQRLLREFAVGHWDAVRVLAKALRGSTQGKGLLDFDLDVRLACIYARDHALAEALPRLEPWRAKLASKTGLFEARVASVHLFAGDTAGYLHCMAQASQAHPGDAARTLDLALAQARFGDAAQADTLLTGIDTGLLPPQGQAYVHWTRGLLLLRRRDNGAEAELGRAVAAFLQRADQPLVWTSLALCACDQAVAMHQAGRSDAARALIAQVWPIVEVHATVPLLRMLEADKLLPAHTHRNT